MKTIFNKTDNKVSDLNNTFNPSHINLIKINNFYEDRQDVDRDRNMKMVKDNLVYTIKQYRISSNDYTTTDEYIAEYIYQGNCKHYESLIAASKSKLNKVTNDLNILLSENDWFINSKKAARVYSMREVFQCAEAEYHNIEKQLRNYKHYYFLVKDKLSNSVR